MSLHSMAKCGVVLALLVTYTGSARCEPLSKAKIAAIGKNATVLIEAGNDRKVQASAFCVHRKGLFVTNDHVVSRSSTANVTVVIGSGSKNQRILKAKVIRQDPELDLALLQTDASPEIVPLEFGSTPGLTELMDLFAFGYPFGSALANSSEEYPAISVNQATISSLRRNNGELYRIQLDAALNPGNSGGPMLNSEGHVVGMVAAGIQGSGVNLAIPVSHIVEFLEKPELQFEPPRLNRENRHQPATFRAKSVSFLPGHNEMKLKLVLKTMDGKRREFEMNAEDETHFVDAVPVLAQTGPPVLHVQARYAGGTVDGLVNDREIRIGDTKVNLLQIKMLTLSPTPVAQLWDGKTLRGMLTKMDTLDVQVGAESLRLMHPRSAQDFRFEPPEEIGVVEATIIAFQNGAEVARESQTINIAGVFGPSRFAGRGTSITPPNISSEEVVRKLPAKVDDVVVGGSGRYLLLKLNEVKKIARFDVNKGDIDHYWPLPSEEIHFAANRTKLFVALPDAGLIQQYDLASAKRDRVKQLPVAAKIEAFAAGSASHGPLIFAVGASREQNQPYRPAGLMFLNSQTLETVERGWIGNPNVTNYLHGNTGVELRCSADGRVVTAWRRGVSPSGILIFQLVGENAMKGWYDHTSVGHIVPGANDDRVYTGKGDYEIDLLTQNSRIGNREWKGPSCLPAVTGKYYLSWNLQFQPGPRRPGIPNQPVSKDVSVHLAGDSRPFAKLRSLTIPYAADYFSREVLSYDKRVHFIPEAKLIVTIPETRDKLVLQKFDAEAALKDSNLDYLFVTSNAPTKARVGETYSYQITAMSSHAELKYKIESGPEGLTVSPDGLVSWSIPQDHSSTSVTVIISVRNPNGAEDFENFTIEISK